MNVRGNALENLLLRFVLCQVLRGPTTQADRNSGFFILIIIGVLYCALFTAGKKQENLSNAIERTSLKGTPPKKKTLNKSVSD